MTPSAHSCAKAWLKARTTIMKAGIDSRRGGTLKEHDGFVRAVVVVFDACLDKI